jgi:hypothetical protein
MPAWRWEEFTFWMSWRAEKAPLSFPFSIGIKFIKLEREPKGPQPVFDAITQSLLK